MNIAGVFSELGIDAITGTGLMDLFKLTPEELAIPQRFNRLKHVISYLSKFPEDTQRFIIAKATRGKNVDPLDHLFEYTSLLKSRQEVEEEMKIAQEQLQMVDGDNSPQIHSGYMDRWMDVKKKLEALDAEIKIYE